MTATRFQVLARQYASGASASSISPRPRSAVLSATGDSRASSICERQVRDGVPRAHVVALLEAARAAPPPDGAATGPPRPLGRSGCRGRPRPGGASPESSRSRRAGSRRRRTRSRSASSSRAPAGSRGRTCAGSSRRRARRRSDRPRGSGSGSRARGSRRGCSCDRHAPLGEAACGRVGLHELGEIARGAAVRGGERLLDDLRDPEERQPPFEEGRDGDLVRGVEDARVGAAELAGPARQREQRERLQVRCGELERQTRRPGPAAARRLRPARDR